MRRSQNFSLTLGTCFSAYIVQAIVTTFPPLLFITFRNDYGVTLAQLSMMVALCFVVQIVVDLICARYADRVGYRFCMVFSSLVAAAGFISMAILPRVMPSPFLGLLLADVLYSIGAGITEVVNSPLVEACPTKRKSAVMSLLHAFYCWGVIAVALLSTLFFVTVGRENWPLLACLWALLPLANAVMFCFVPMASLADQVPHQMKLKDFISSKLFWVLMILMLASGASEQAVAQWVSAFAEANLGISKTVGDLAGLCVFALLMGIFRSVYAKVSDRISPRQAMLFCGFLAIVSYIIIVLPVHPVINLLGCGLSGIAVSILWPATLSYGAQLLPAGGTALFAFMAVAGDVGCSLGPSVVGTMSDWFDDELKFGFAAALIFPLLLLAGLLLLKKLRAARS